MLVNCAAYEKGQKLADIPVRDISTYLHRPDCFVWVAIKDPEPEELEDMRREFDLHELAIEDSLHGHQRPKIDEYGASVFAVLHAIEPAGEELNVGEIAIFVGPSYVLSIRRGTERGFIDVRQRCEREPELLQHGPGYVLYALMDAVVDRYFPVLDNIATQIDAIEERMFTTQATRANLEVIYQLKQRLTILKHAVEPLLEATGKLFGGRVPRVCAGLHEYFRDVYDHLVRLNQSIDGLRDAVTTVISINLSLVTIHDNEVTKRLAGYAALIAVPTMIAGLYGMNFEHMPELDWVLGYPLVLGVMAAIDGYLVIRLRRAGWL
jgi:magnesium transporter